MGITLSFSAQFSTVSDSPGLGNARGQLCSAPRSVVERLHARKYVEVQMHRSGGVVNEGSRCGMPGGLLRDGGSFKKPASHLRMG